MEGKIILYSPPLGRADLDFFASSLMRFKGAGCLRKTHPLDFFELSRIQFLMRGAQTSPATCVAPVGALSLERIIAEISGGLNCLALPPTSTSTAASPLPVRTTLYGTRLISSWISSYLRPMNRLME